MSIQEEYAIEAPELAPDVDFSIIYDTELVSLGEGDRTPYPENTLQRQKPLRSYNDVRHPYCSEARKLFQFTVTDVKPLIPGGPAVPGTVDSFAGILAHDFPELSKLSDEELEDSLNRMRRRT